MKLIIDIPEEMYQKIKETNTLISGRRSGRTFDYVLFNAINTGTPLDKLKERISLEKLGYTPSAGYHRAITKVLQIIDNENEVSE